MSRVLIAEDDESTRELLKFIVSHAGFQVETAADGQQAARVGHGLFLVDGVRVLREDLLVRTRAEGSACTICQVHASCRNCPGSAVVETGSMYGRSEYLCETNQAIRG